jgi:hypothetical protein
MRSGRNFDQIEAEYVTGEESIRTLAKSHHLAPATLSRRAKLDGWAGKRDAYRASVAEKGYDLLADRDAVQYAVRNEQMLRISDQVFQLVEQQVPVWREQIAAGKTPISVREFELIAKLTRLIIGQPTSRSEERKGVLSVHTFDQGTIERLERAARLRLDDGGGSAGDAESPVAASGSR